MIVGQISLNLSFFTYMFLYLPQVIHNQKRTSLEGLSKRMHLILYLAYFLDLLYGFGKELPWQYRAVSATGWLLLTIQHLQLIHHFKNTLQMTYRRVFYSIMLSICAILIWGISQKPFANLSLNFIGYISQIGFSLAFIPQIMKSKQLQSAAAMNHTYILLSVFLAILDAISAWQLGWGWPNQLGACLAILFSSVLMLQYYRYQPRLSSISINHVE